METCFKNNPNNKFCTDFSDYFDAVVALDLKTGAIKWANRAMAYDAWNVNCIISNPAGPVPGADCPELRPDQTMTSAELVQIYSPSATVTAKSGI